MMCIYDDLYTQTHWRKYMNICKKPSINIAYYVCYTNHSIYGQYLLTTLQQSVYTAKHYKTFTRHFHSWIEFLSFENLKYFV